MGGRSNLKASGDHAKRLSAKVLSENGKEEGFFKGGF